jgi:hypothetical protein
MAVAARRSETSESELATRIATLARATSRREKLEALFADKAYLDKTLTDGRYMRLCAAIAWASEREEQARQEVEFRTMVAALRTSGAAWLEDSLRRA